MAPFVVEATEDVRTCPSCGQRVHARKTFGGFVCPLCGHKMSGGHDSKEGRQMAPQSSDVTRLLTEAASAPTYVEQQRLIGAAEQAKTEITVQATVEREVDLASATVGERLTPVRVHEHHTAATDWLGEIDTAPDADADRSMVAQGSVWYAQLPEMVKQHPDELAQQALGMAQRLAGKFGSGADSAERTFLDHVGTLHARDVHSGLISVVAASGVPQVGEAGHPEEGPGVQGPQTTMGLPAELTSSERAPAMRDLMNNTSGGSVSDTEWPDPLQLPQQDVDAANGDSNTARVAALRKRSYEGVDQSDLDYMDQMHSDELHRSLARMEGNGNADHPLAHAIRDHLTVRHLLGTPGHPFQLNASNERTASMQQHTAACPECSGCQACGGTHRVAVRARTAASGLDQVDQTIDPHDNAKATPYPTDVAFPWEMPNDSGQAIQETEQQIAQREQLKGASRRQVAEQAAHQAAQQAYRRVMAGQDDSGWLGDMGAGGVRPGMQDTGNPGNTYPGNLADADPVYGQGGDQGNQPLKPYGADEADDYTNNPGMNIQPGAPMQYDQAGRGNQVGQATGRRSDEDPQIAKALAFVRSRRALLDNR